MRCSWTKMPTTVKIVFFPKLIPTFKFHKLMLKFAWKLKGSEEPQGNPEVEQIF